MKFYFSVAYTPYPKADTQEWITEQEALSLQEAEAEITQRYPASEGYRFSPASIRKVHDAEHYNRIIRE